MNNVLEQLNNLIILDFVEMNRDKITDRIGEFNIILDQLDNVYLINNYGNIYETRLDIENELVEFTEVINGVENNEN